MTFQTYRTPGRLIVSATDSNAQSLFSPRKGTLLTSVPGASALVGFTDADLPGQAWCQSYLQSPAPTGNVAVVMINPGYQTNIVVLGIDTSGLTGTMSVTSVANGGQQLIGTGSGGTFVLIINGSPTSPIPFNASNATITNAINAVANPLMASITGGPLPNIPVIIYLFASYIGTIVSIGNLEGSH